MLLECQDSYCYDVTRGVKNLCKAVCGDVSCIGRKIGQTDGDAAQFVTQEAANLTLGIVWYAGRTSL